MCTPQRRPLCCHFKRARLFAQTPRSRVADFYIELEIAWRQYTWYVTSFKVRENRHAYEQQLDTVKCAANEQMAVAKRNTDETMAVAKRDVDVVKRNADVSTTIPDGNREAGSAVCRCA